MHCGIRGKYTGRLCVYPDSYTYPDGYVFPRLVSVTAGSIDLKTNSGLIHPLFVID